MPRLRSVLLFSVALVVVGVGACNLLLPERFAVNAPMLHQMLGFGGPGAPAEATVGERMRVAGGLHVGVFASGLPNVRTLRTTPGGHLLAVLPREGQVVLIEPDRDGDGESDGTRELLADLASPYGLDVDDRWLYVGLGGSVIRVPFDDAAGRITGAPETIVPKLPAGGNHWTRTLRIGPDGKLYVTVGSSCNVCIEEHDWRAAMLRFERDGSGAELYASGLRNSVGFDWQPGTGALFATDNGRDLLGDDFPPCELNRIEQGNFYGWPYANGDGTADPDFGTKRPDLVARTQAPAFNFRAHNAPLGMAFLSSPATPVPLQGAALVALHGSWNRTSKDGYKVVSLHWDADGNIESRDFLTGFLVDEDVIGRPAEIAQSRDGTIYIADDYADVIWRVSTSKTGAPSTLPGQQNEAANPLAGLSSAERSTAHSEGKALYQEHACAGCHDPQNPTPGVVPIDLAKRKLRTSHSIASLQAFLATPTPPMPVAPLDNEERRRLAIYLLREERP